VGGIDDFVIDRRDFSSFVFNNLQPGACAEFLWREEVLAVGCARRDH
jgi:hypothetical protein